MTQMVDRPEETEGEVAIRDAPADRLLTDGMTPDADRAAELREALVDKLRADGKITSPAVEAAFRAVARVRFLPPDASQIPPDAFAMDKTHGIVTIRWPTPG